MHALQSALQGRLQVIPGRKTGIFAFIVHLKPDLHTGWVLLQQETGPLREVIATPRAAVRQQVGCLYKNSGVMPFRAGYKY